MRENQRIVANVMTPAVRLVALILKRAFFKMGAVNRTATVTSTSQFLGKMVAYTQHICLLECKISDSFVKCFAHS